MSNVSLDPAHVLLDAKSGWRRMLASRPVQNTAASVLSQDDEQVRIELHLKPPGWLVPPLSWLIRPWWQQRTVTLQGPGYQVWQWCDGLTEVEDIVDRFAEKHRLSFHEARVSVTQYLSTLIRRGVLAIILPEQT